MLVRRTVWFVLLTPWVDNHGSPLVTVSGLVEIATGVLSVGWVTTGGVMVILGDCIVMSAVLWFCSLSMMLVMVLKICASSFR